MTELQKNEVEIESEAEDFSDELSDEALDRVEHSHSCCCCYQYCAPGH